MAAFWKETISVNRRERLIDNYEDALFAVLMDKVAEEEGAKLREENQRLQEDPAFEVPEHVDAVARQTIRKAFAGKNRHSALHVAKRVLNTVAMIVLICSAIFATAYAAFPEVRVRTLNYLIQSSEVSSRLVLLNDDDKSNRIISNNEDLIICGYSIPQIEGFSIIGMNEDRLGGWVEYQSVTGETVRIGISTSNTKYLDTENVDSIEDVSIHGYSGILLEKNNRVILAWAEPDHNTYITLVCNNLQKSFALQTAEQIVYIAA